jgi:predicted transcriptional regulator
MAIQAEYAQAILAGTKTVEFRKRRLAPDIRTVLIYETSPTQRVVGYFSIDETIASTPEALWERFAAVGGIRHEAFHRYYGKAATAVGLKIESAERFTTGVSLSDLTPSPPAPQSFLYLDRQVLQQIDRRQSRSAGRIPNGPAPRSRSLLTTLPALVASSR